MQEWQDVEQKYLYASKEIDSPRRVGQHARINTTSLTFYGWVNMQEWWVNMNRNGGSTWSGIYT